MDATQKFVIFQDANGQELGRKVRGRGRPPIDAVKDNDGNLVVKNCTKNGESIVLPSQKEEKAQVFYIIADENGAELSRRIKGRGRPMAGYDLATDGIFAGHYVSVKTEETEVEAAEAAEVVPA